MALKLPYNFIGIFNKLYQLPINALTFHSSQKRRTLISNDFLRPLKRNVNSNVR